MARCCGGTGTCACKVQAGRNTTVTGDGSAQNPFVVGSDVALTVEDSQTFDLGLSGTGTLASPWLLSVGYRDGARLTDLPDVNADAPGAWQVLAWDPSAQRWVAAPPVTATPGQVVTDGTLDGDGSPGAPLKVHPDAARFLQVSTSGVGLTNAGLNQLVRVFPDEDTRAASPIPPVVNSISVLGTRPGELDYYDGSDWVPITNGVALDVQPGQMLSLSGLYTGGQVTQYVAQVSATTASDGTFDVIPSTDLLTYAGVLSVQFQETGTTPYKATVRANVNKISGTAYRVDNGAPYAGLVLTGVVTALLY